MLRFPNPGSTIQNFVAVYRAAIEKYGNQVVDLDDIIRAAVEANLATSSGHMGEAAISRSTRPDRSRDPLYNQLKMYAELFRWLGWLRSTENSALNYTFTLLGEQVALSGRYWRPLVGETVLGIASPSHVMKKLSDQEIRPFAAILRTMLMCDDGLSRDEMIVGPLSAASDRSSASVETIAAEVMALRAEAAAIQEALKALSGRRGVQVNTLRNYTRWPLAVMRDLRWTVKERERYLHSTKTFEIHRLTSLGKERAQTLESYVDIRVDQVDQLRFQQKRALSRYAHFAMLERAGFNISSVTNKLRGEESTRHQALSVLGAELDAPILFSPFQSLSVADSSVIFRGAVQAKRERESDSTSKVTQVGRGSRGHLYVVPSFVASEAVAEGLEVQELGVELQAHMRAYGSVCEAARSFAATHEEDGKEQFYPLVTQLLRLLGFRSDYSRAGVNYQRWDACVWLEELAIPIEIKSPSEEQYLSNKAVRQALENKVILLARGGLETKLDTTSLIVGYRIPNARADMSMLIDDIDTAFGICIGVIDLESLVILAIRTVTESISMDEAQLSRLKGFLDVGSGST